MGTKTENMDDGHVCVCVPVYLQYTYMHTFMHVRRHVSTLAESSPECQTLPPPPRETLRWISIV